MKLEVYASKLFNDFCKNQGINGIWDYLSPERKLAWIQEAHYLLKSAVIELKGSFKPIKQGRPQASYEIGYYQGMSAERLATISYLDYCIEDLSAQYEDLKNKYNK